MARSFGAPQDLEAPMVLFVVVVMVLLPVILAGLFIIAVAVSLRGPAQRAGDSEGDRAVTGFEASVSQTE